MQTKPDLPVRCDKSCSFSSFDSHIFPLPASVFTKSMLSIPTASALSTLPTCLQLLYTYSIVSSSTKYHLISHHSLSDSNSNPTLTHPREHSRSDKCQNFSQTQFICRSPPSPLTLTLELNSQSLVPQTLTSSQSHSPLNDAPVVSSLKRSFASGVVFTCCPSGSLMLG